MEKELGCGTVSPGFWCGEILVRNGWLKVFLRRGSWHTMFFDAFCVKSVPCKRCLISVSAVQTLWCKTLSVVFLLLGIGFVVGAKRFLVQTE